MSKPILVITAPHDLAEGGLQDLVEKWQQNKDYQVIGVSDPRAERVEFRLLNAGLWELLFDYLRDRRRRRHERELDRLQNKLHRMTEKAERIAEERQHYRIELDRIVRMQNDNRYPGPALPNHTTPTP